MNTDQLQDIFASEPETDLLRTISRAVIRRVRQEHSELQGAELLERIQMASPFREAGPDLQVLWDEEVALSMPEFRSHHSTCVH